MVEFAEENELNEDFLTWPLKEVQDFGEFDGWFNFEESKLKGYLAELQTAEVLNCHCKLIRPVDDPSPFDHFMATHDLISIYLRRRRVDRENLRFADPNDFPITDDEKDAWSYFVDPINLELFPDVAKLCTDDASGKLLNKAFEECKANAQKQADAQFMDALNSSGTLLTCP